MLGARRKQGEETDSEWDIKRARDGGCDCLWTPVWATWAGLAQLPVTPEQALSSQPAAPCTALTGRLGV